MKFQVFWDVTTGRMVNGYRNYGGEFFQEEGFSLQRNANDFNKSACARIYSKLEYPVYLTLPSSKEVKASHTNTKAKYDVVEFRPISARKDTHLNNG
jgi:hypothetical protein